MLKLYVCKAMVNSDYEDDIKLYSYVIVWNITLLYDCVKWLQTYALYYWPGYLTVTLLAIGIAMKHPFILSHWHTLFILVFKRKNIN